MLIALAQAATSPPDPSDDFSPMCFALVCAAVGVMCAAFIVFCLACVCVAALALLLAAGIAGATLTGIGLSSVFIGLLRGRFFAFFHAFCLQIAAILGLLAGLGIGAGVKWLAADTSWGKALGFGALIGGLLGTLAGHLFAKLCRWVVVQLAETAK